MEQTVFITVSSVLSRLRKEMGGVGQKISLEMIWQAVLISSISAMILEPG